jgi:hypothetical protein
VSLEFSIGRQHRRINRHDLLAVNMNSINFAALLPFLGFMAFFSLKFLTLIQNPVPVADTN